MCSRPATSRACSTWSATCASVARGARIRGPPGVERGHRRRVVGARGMLGVDGDLVQPELVPARVLRGGVLGALLRDEVRHERDHHDAAVAGQPPQDVVRDVPRRWSISARQDECEKITGAAETSSAACIVDGRDVREVDQHADPVHLPHDLPAEVGEPADRRLRRWRRPPTARSGCGSASCRRRRAGAASAARPTRSRCCARPRRPSSAAIRPPAIAPRARRRRCGPARTSPGSARQSAATQSICSSVAVTAAPPTRVPGT